MPIRYLCRHWKERGERSKNNYREKWTREGWKNSKKETWRQWWKWKTDSRSLRHFPLSYHSPKSLKRISRTWRDTISQLQWIRSCFRTQARLLWVWLHTTNFCFQHESTCLWTTKIYSVKIKNTMMREGLMMIKMRITSMELRGWITWRSWNKRKRWESTSQWGRLREWYQKREWRRHWQMNGKRAVQCQVRRSRVCSASWPNRKMKWSSRFQKSRRTNKKRKRR